MNNTNISNNEKPVVYNPTTMIDVNSIVFEVTENQAKKLENVPTIYKNNAKIIFGLFNLSENIGIKTINIMGEMHETYKKAPIKKDGRTVGFSDFVCDIFGEYIDKDRISRMVNIYTYITCEPYFDEVREQINEFSYSNLIAIYQYIKKNPSEKKHVKDLITMGKLHSELSVKAFKEVLTAVELSDKNNGTDNNGTDNNGTDNNGTDNNGTDNNGTDNNGTDNNGTDNNGTDNNGTDNNGTDNGTDNNGTDNNGTDNNGNNDDEVDEFTRLENGIGYKVAAIEIGGNVTFGIYTTMGMSDDEVKQIVKFLENLDGKRKK